MAFAPLAGAHLSQNCTLRLTLALLLHRPPSLCQNTYRRSPSYGDACCSLLLLGVSLALHALRSRNGSAAAARLPIRASCGSWHWNVICFLRFPLWKRHVGGSCQNLILPIDCSCSVLSHALPRLDCSSSQFPCGNIGSAFSASLQTTSCTPAACDEMRSITPLLCTPGCRSMRLLRNRPLLRRHHRPLALCRPVTFPLFRHAAPFITGVRSSRFAFWTVLCPFVC